MGVRFNAQTGKYDLTDDQGNVTQAGVADTHEQALTFSLKEGTPERIAADANTTSAAQSGGTLTQDLFTGAPVPQGTPTGFTPTPTPTPEPKQTIYKAQDGVHYIATGDGQVRVATSEEVATGSVQTVGGSDVDFAFSQLGLTRQPGGAADATVSTGGESTTSPTFEDWITSPEGKAFIESLGPQVQTKEIDGTQAMALAREKFEQELPKLTAEKLGEGTSGVTTADGTPISAAFDKGVQDAIQGIGVEGGAPIDFDLLRSLPGINLEDLDKVQAGFTPEGFKALQENKQAQDIQDANEQTTAKTGTEIVPSGGDSPYSFLQDYLTDYYAATGFDEVKEAAEALLKEINEDNKEFAEKVGQINENPWLSEGARNRQIAKAELEHSQLTAGKRTQYEALLANQERIAADAKWAAGLALNAYFQDRSLDLQEAKFAFDKAEAEAAARSSAGEGQFTLGKNQIRYDADGNPIAYGPVDVEGTELADYDQFELESAGFAQRMLDSEAIISQGPVIAAGERGDDLSHRQWKAAVQNWITAKLRQESGASIAKEEFETAAEAYIPKIGDSEKTLQIKARNRDVAVQAMKFQSQGAWADLNELTGTITETGQIQWTSPETGATYNLPNPYLN